MTFFIGMDGCQEIFGDQVRVQHGGGVNDGSGGGSTGVMARLLA